MFQTVLASCCSGWNAGWRICECWLMNSAHCSSESTGCFAHFGRIRVSLVQEQSLFLTLPYPSLNFAMHTARYQGIHPKGTFAACQKPNSSTVIALRVVGCSRTFCAIHNGCLVKPNSQCVGRASRRFGRLRPAALSFPQFAMKRRGKAPNTIISVKYDSVLQIISARLRCLALRPRAAAL